MMNQDALDQCLQAIVAGESLEACLARFPDQRQDLEPMLMAVLRLQAVRRLEAPSAFRQAGRGRLLAAIEVAPQPAISGRTPLFQQFKAFFAGVLHPPRLAPLAMRLALALIVLLAGTVTTTYAAQTALPGNPLYAVKLAGEDVHLYLASNPATLRLVFAQRRLDEAEALQQRGQARNLPSVLGRYDQILLAWSSAAESAGLQDPADASHRLAAQLEQLHTLAQQAPPDQQALVQASQQVTRQAQLHLPPPPPSAPSPTPSPSPESQPDASATAAPTPGLIPQPSVTPTAGRHHSRPEPTPTSTDDSARTPATTAPDQGGHRGPDGSPSPHQTPDDNSDRPGHTPPPGAPDSTPAPGRTPGSGHRGPADTPTPAVPDQTPTPGEPEATATPAVPSQTPTPGDGHGGSGPGTPGPNQTPGGGNHGGSTHTPAPGGPHTEQTSGPDPGGKPRGAAG